jgi:hypothetical protein
MSSGSPTPCGWGDRHRYQPLPRGIAVREFRYPFDFEHSHAKLKAWLADNLEGRWMIRHKGSRVRVAFENDFDAMTYILPDWRTATH